MAENHTRDPEARATLAYLADQFSPDVECRLVAADALLADLARLSGEEGFLVRVLPEGDDADYEVRFEGAPTEVRVRLGVGGEIFIKSRTNDERPVPLVYNRLTARLEGMQPSTYLTPCWPRKSALTALLEAIARFSGEQKVELE